MTHRPSPPSITLKLAKQSSQGYSAQRGHDLSYRLVGAQPPLGAPRRGVQPTTHGRCVRLPGFGTPLPDGFEPTKEAYAEWLTGKLASFDESIHLVAHDWGALLSLRVLAGQPTNIASWVLDTGNIDDDFAWHDMAQLWISPGGEEFMEGLLAMSVEDRAAMLAGAGVPEIGALDIAAGIDATMAASILSL